MDSDQSLSDRSEDELSSSSQDLQILEEARRAEVLKAVNIDDSSDEKNQVMELLDRKNKRQQKKAKYDEDKDLKKMRAKNAKKFFIKIKMHVLKNFKDSIMEAKRAQKHTKEEIPKMLSYLNLSTLELFHQLTALKNVKVKDFSRLLDKIFNENNLQLESAAKYKICWSLGNHFGLKMSKVCFIDISHIDLESFYNLKYTSNKGKKKKINKQLDILKNKIQRKIIEEEVSEQVKKTIPISAYSFNSNYSEDSQQIAKTTTLSTINESLLKLKQSFKKSFFKIYCPLKEEWELFNAETLDFYDIEFIKKNILENRAIIGFYSLRVMKFLPQFSYLINERKYNNLQFRDLTPEFCDKYENVLKRRLRLGVKSLYRNLIKQSNFYKTLSLFPASQIRIIQSFQKMEQNFAKQHFPKSTKQMKMSEYYVVPSLIDKYKILKEDAQPIPDLQFHEEKVYRKKDLIRVASRMGWVDLCRMVQQGEQPIKTTQTRTKKPTKLYKFSQTEPFALKIEENGDFILDEEYNSVYVPPNFSPPEGITTVKQNIDYICKKHKFKSARIVQGFNLASFHIVPNNIGFFLYQKDKQQIMSLYHERQEKLLMKKEARKQESTINLWKKLFKSILITQQIS